MILLSLRIVATWLVLTATAMLVAGCGGSSHTSSIGATVGADKPIPSPQAVTYADAVNLRAADVPGLQAARLKPRAETADGPFGAAIDRCESAAVRVGKIFGITSQRYVHLSSPLKSVGSGVYYFKSEALAREYFTAAHSPRFAACVKTVASNRAKTVTREGSKVAEPMFNEPRLSTLPASLPGVPAYGLRLATHPSLGGPGRSEAYTDFLSFVKGDAVITLTAIGQTHPFPAARERRLLALLYTRAEAHKL
jgi:hypothetical protein